MEGEKEKGGVRKERERKGRRGERKRERVREERERERGEGGKGRRERERKGRAGRSGECTRTWHRVTGTTSNSLSNNPGIFVNGYHCETPSIH